MMESIGQKVEVWTDEWKGLSIESEIQMWDYFGLRPWILKYTPRYGEVLEAGCGLGRYNFLLSHFGVNISGLDFSKETIDHLNIWQAKNGYNLKFVTGDVKKLPYDDNSLSGYLSFGVIEHFQEGPKEVLDEVYRVLRPGGVAIITTPNKSWSVKKNNLKKGIKDIIKKIIGRTVSKQPFFQYEYTPEQLKEFMVNSKLLPTEITGGDYLFSFLQNGKYKKKAIDYGSIAYRLSPIADKLFIRKYGAQSISISVKKSDVMHCFLCGELNAKIDCLNYFNVPICNKCEDTQVAKYYLKAVKTRFNHPFSIEPDILEVANIKCEYCGETYLRNGLFEDMGLNRNVCPECLMNTEKSIEVSNISLKPIWRHRSSKRL